MATLLTEDFEGGTTGTALTNANTTFNGFITTTSPPTFDASIFISGTRSALFNPAATVEYAAHTFTPTGTFSDRFYANINALPAAATYLITVLSGTTTTVAQVGINANGTVRLRGGAGGTTLQATSTAVLTPGNWYRFEWIVNAAAGTQALRVFLGHGTTVITGADLTGTITSSATVDRFLLGVPVSGTLTWNADAVLATDTAAFLGPVAGASGTFLADSGVHLQVATGQAGYGQAGYGQGGYGGGGDVVLSQPTYTFIPDSAYHAQYATGTAGASDATITAPIPAAPVLFGTPVVEIGFTTDPTVGGGLYLHWDDPQRGLWDQALWAPDDLRTNVTSRLQTVSWQRGATRVEGPVPRYEAATATIVLRDPDGRFNPLNLAGPYVSAGRTQVRPMVRVWISVDYGGVRYPQATLYADSWDIDYFSPDEARVTLTATDGQKVISRHTRTARPYQGSGELPGARVNRILDDISWPRADRIIDAGNTPLQGTNLEGDPWDELLLVQDTELGEVFLDPAGKVVFRDRYTAITDTTATTSQGVFGSDRAGGELPYAAIQPSYDDTTIRNVVRIGRVGGIVQEARDDASVAEFLEVVHERSDLLMQTDAEALSYAQYLLGWSKDPELLFTDIAVDPRAQPKDLFPQVLQRDFGHRITVRARPPGVGLVERDVFIRGVAGEYAGTNRWGWRWTLQPADVQNYLIWDSPTGKWGTSKWAY